MYISRNIIPSMRLFLLLILLICGLNMVDGMCYLDCPGCTCTENSMDDEVQLTVECRDYNQTVLPTCLTPNVTRLYVFGSRLQAIERPDFANVPHLKELVIMNSPDLMMLLEGAFITLTELESLRMEGTALMDIHGQPFGGLSNMTYISLRNNNLGGVNDDTFVGLVNLQVLDLSNNQISYIEDNSFNFTINMLQLNMSHNQMIKMTGTQLTGLDNLEQLDLSSNQLQHLNDAFNNTKKLSRLDLSGNQLSSLGEQELNGLQNLQSLDLNNNLLIDVPTESFTDLVVLENLYLSANMIPMIQSNAFKGLTKLKTLRLDATGLWTLEDESFAGLETLISLSISYNTDLERVIPEALSGEDLPMLEELYLTDNNIETFDEDLLRDKPTLKIVRLEGNPLDCSCSASWIRIKMDDPQAVYANDWKSGPGTLFCSTPSNLMSMRVVDIDMQDLTCDEPRLLESRQNINGIKQEALFEVLLKTGLPSTKWVMPNNTAILPNNTIQYGPKQTMISVVQMHHENGTIHSKLTFSKTTSEINGNYTVIATNAGGTKEITFVLDVDPDDKDKHIAVIGILLSTIIVVALVIGVVYFRKRIKGSYDRMRDGQNGEEDDHEPGFSPHGGEEANFAGQTHTGYGGTRSAKSVNAEVESAHIVT